MIMTTTTKTFIAIFVAVLTFLTLGVGSSFASVNGNNPVRINAVNAHPTQVVPKHIGNYDVIPVPKVSPNATQYYELCTNYAAVKECLNNSGNHCTVGNPVIGYHYLSQVPDNQLVVFNPAYTNGWVLTFANCYGAIAVNHSIGDKLQIQAVGNPIPSWQTWIQSGWNPTALYTVYNYDFMILWNCQCQAVVGQYRGANSNLYPNT